MGRDLTEDKKLVKIPQSRMPGEKKKLYLYCRIKYTFWIWIIRSQSILSEPERINSLLDSSYLGYGIPTAPDKTCGAVARGRLLGGGSDCYACNVTRHRYAPIICQSTAPPVKLPGCLAVALGLGLAGILTIPVTYRFHVSDLIP